MCTQVEAKNAAIEAIKEMVPQLVASIVSETAKHNVPSPDTILRFTEIEKRMSENERKNDVEHGGIMDAITGLSEDIKKAIPLITTWNELVSTGKWSALILKTIVWFIVSVGVVIGSIYSIKEWIKH